MAQGFKLHSVPELELACVSTSPLGLYFAETLNIFFKINHFSSVSRQTFDISALIREISVSVSEMENFFLNEESIFFGQAFFEKRSSGSI